MEPCPPLGEITVVLGGDYLQLPPNDPSHRWNGKDRNGHYVNERVLAELSCPSAPWEHVKELKISTRARQNSYSSLKQVFTRIAKTKSLGNNPLPLESTPKIDEAHTHASNWCTKNSIHDVGVKKWFCGGQKFRRWAQQRDAGSIAGIYCQPVPIDNSGASLGPWPRRNTVREYIMQEMTYTVSLTGVPRIIWNSKKVHC